MGTARGEPGVQLLCSPKPGLNLLLFHFFVLLCRLYLPQIFLLWSYFRLSSKGSVPFLSINLHIKEIAPCSASVFRINAKKPPHYPDFPFFAVMPGGINTCPSQRFHSWNSSISNTLYIFFFFLIVDFFIIILMLLYSHLCFPASVFHFLPCIFCFCFPPNGSRHLPVLGGSLIQFLSLTPRASCSL